MGQRLFVRTGVATAVAVFVTGLVLTGSRPLRQGAEGKEKTVEQVRKNIQVLKGLPASQLNPVMDFMAASLGVRCQFCHTADSSGWQFEKDDKPEKRTARKMIQMVMDLNAKTFGGENAVTCFTCHHGSNDPVRLIPLPRPQAGNQPEGPEAVPSFPAVDKVVAMYEQAIGGADAVGKISSRVMKGVNLDSRGQEAPIEIAQQNPDKYSSALTMREGAVMTRGYNGSTGWMTSPRGARELAPEQVEELKRDGALFPLSRIHEFSKTLHITEKDTVDGAMAYLLVTPAGEHTTERYYIDTASGLLLRRVVVMETTIGDIPEQVDYSDYRPVDGVKVPFTVRTAGVDPRDGSTLRVTSVAHNVPIDEKKFTKPEIKPQGPRR